MAGELFRTVFVTFILFFVIVTIWLAGSEYFDRILPLIDAPVTNSTVGNGSLQYMTNTYYIYLPLGLLFAFLIGSFFKFQNDKRNVP